MINYNNFINQMFNLLVKVNVVNSDELVILIEDSIKLSNKDFPYCSSIKSIHSKKIFNKYERYFKFTTKSDSIKLQKEYQKKHLSEIQFLLESSELDFRLKMFNRTKTVLSKIDNIKFKKYFNDICYSFMSLFFIMSEQLLLKSLMGLVFKKNI